MESSLSCYGCTVRRFRRIIFFCVRLLSDVVCTWYVVCSRDQAWWGYVCTTGKFKRNESLCALFVVLCHRALEWVKLRVRTKLQKFKLLPTLYHYHALILHSGNLNFILYLTLKWQQWWKLRVTYILPVCLIKYLFFFNKCTWILLYLVF